MALSNASASCKGKDIGFANPILYQVAATEPSAFNDVTTGNNDLTGRFKGRYPATRGYDMATGLGTPNGSQLPAALCAGAPVDPVSVVNPGNQRSHPAQAVHLQIVATDTTSGQRLTYQEIGLPTGVTIGSSDGLITGTPSTAGTYPVFVTARDAAGSSASVSFSWAVDLAITSPATATATIGKYFSFTVRTTGIPRRFSRSPAPPGGLGFKNQGNGTAILSGTPNGHDTAGTYPLVFEAVFGTWNAPVPVYQKFTLTLLPAP